MTTMGPSTPILRIFDEGQARRFYVDYLGFTTSWEHRFEEKAPLYTEVRRGSCVLHLSMHHGDACPGAALRIPCPDPGILLEELRGRPHPGQRPRLLDVPWGPPELSLLDPFGNRLVFHQKKGGAL